MGYWKADKLYLHIPYLTPDKTETTVESQDQPKYLLHQHQKQLQIHTRHLS